MQFLSNNAVMVWTKLVVSTPTRDREAIGYRALNSQDCGVALNRIHRVTWAGPPAGG